MKKHSVSIWWATAVMLALLAGVIFPEPLIRLLVLLFISFTFASTYDLPRAVCMAIVLLVSGALLYFRGWHGMDIVKAELWGLLAFIAYMGLYALWDWIEWKMAVRKLQEDVEHLKEESE